MSLLVFCESETLNDQLCLFTMLYAPREQHERILADFATPIARDLRGGRSCTPCSSRATTCRLAGALPRPRAARLDRGPVREGRAELGPLQAAGAVGGSNSPSTTGARALRGEREALAESSSCTTRWPASTDCSRRQGCSPTRREWSMLMTEGLLDCSASTARSASPSTVGFRGRRKWGPGRAELETVEKPIRR